GTSAGGAAEAGKSLRVPGTNPFFFNDDAMQGNRLLELLETIPDLEAFVLNTGRIGGEGEGSKKVTIPDSSAIVQGIVEGTIEWETDPDFGYQVATSDRKSTRLNSSHVKISYAVFCLKKNNINEK